MRTGRQQGGVSTYVKDNLTVVKNKTFSNGYCEALVIAIKEMDILIVNGYRPPKCNYNQFKEMTDQIAKWTSNDSRELMIIGDFNFKSMDNWSDINIQNLRKRGAKDINVQGDLLKQELALLNLIEEEFLTQIVQEKTRKDSLLDLVLTNSANRRGVEVTDNIELSDHATVRLGYEIDKPKDRNEGADTSLHTTDIPSFDYNKLSEEGWEKVNNTLRNSD